ncbi:MAG: lecithin retinol acyltransferase family protein [Desmonostoc geniculatum HA4340-LM1]|jgi:hypothetical protein|nr:lecithin retinol acyltransferase family protein [Desmonostoc geniculatum HA4340-LM1]
MATGDHIFIWGGNPIVPTFTHHGIDCGNDRVIHFTGLNNKIKPVIQQTSLVTFASNNVKGKK